MFSNKTPGSGEEMAHTFVILQFARLQSNLKNKFICFITVHVADTIPWNYVYYTAIMQKRLWNHNLFIYYFILINA